MASAISEEEDLITCSVCFHEYNSIERKPKFLQCAHTICISCLLAIINPLDGHCKCPICRKNFVVQDVIGLPNNAYALHILKTKEEKMKQDAAKATNLKLIKWCLICNAAEKPQCVPSDHTVQYMISENIILLDSFLKLKAEFLTRKHEGKEKVLMAIEKHKEVRGQLNKISNSIDVASKLVKHLQDTNESKVTHLNSLVESLKISSKEDKRSFVNEFLAEDSNPNDKIEILRVEMNNSVDYWEQKIRDSKVYTAIYTTMQKTRIALQMYDENQRSIKTWLNDGFRLEPSAIPIQSTPLVRAHCELINHAACLLSTTKEEQKTLLMNDNSEQSNPLVARTSIANTLPSPNTFALDRSIFTMKLYCSGSLAEEIHIRPMATGLSLYHREFIKKLGDYCYKSPKEFKDFIDAAGNAHVIFRIGHQLSPRNFNPGEIHPTLTSTSVFGRDCNEEDVWLNLTQRHKPTVFDVLFLFPLVGCKNVPGTLTPFMSHAVRFGRIINHHRMLLMKSISNLYQVSHLQRQNYTMVIESV